MLYHLEHSVWYSLYNNESIIVKVNQTDKIDETTDYQFDEHEIVVRLNSFKHITAISFDHFCILHLINKALLVYTYNLFVSI